MKYQLKSKVDVSFMVNVSDIVERTINGEKVKTYKDAAKLETVTLRPGAGEIKADKKVIDRLGELEVFQELIAEGDLFLPGNKKAEELYGKKTAAKSERAARAQAEQKRRQDLVADNAANNDELTQTKAELAELKAELAEFKKAVGG